jgi:hypothetical protein
LDRAHRAEVGYFATSYRHRDVVVLVRIVQAETTYMMIAMDTGPCSSRLCNTCYKKIQRFLLLRIQEEHNLRIFSRQLYKLAEKGNPSCRTEMSAQEAALRMPSENPLTFAAACIDATCIPKSTSSFKLETLTSKPPWYFHQ